MKVFLSWSGAKSKQVAVALRDWLPGVLQSVEPWLSSEDMPIGARWASDVASALENVDVGILCLTAENISSPWLIYEAGALSKQTTAAMVMPYLLDLSPAEVRGPLAQFQCALANRDDTFRLVHTLYRKSADHPVSDKQLERIFEVWWPELDQKLSTIRLESVVEPVPQRSVHQKIDEVLFILRQVAPSVQANTIMRSEASFEQPPIDSKVRPRVFIGSSSEGLEIAEAIQLGLDAVAECTIWNQSAFQQSITNIENLVDIGRTFDAAVLVLTPDDLLSKRGVSGPAPRDNIIFEAGLFTGMLGRARTFLVHAREPAMTLPSDLAGVTAATYSRPSDGNLHAALGAVCTRIKRALGLSRQNAA